MVVDRRAEAAAVSAMASGSQHSAIKAMSHLDGALAVRVGAPTRGLGRIAPR
jgi:hypothetical protein